MVAVNTVDQSIIVAESIRGEAAICLRALVYQLAVRIMEQL